MFELGGMMILGGVVALLAFAKNWEKATDGPKFLPLPEGVTEVCGFGTDGGIVELKDGTLMLAQGGGINDGARVPAEFRISKDGGKSWSDPKPLDCKIGVGGMIRLESGELAIYGRSTTPGAGLWDYYFSSSADDGKTWAEPTLITNYPSYYPMFHSMIQLKSGRLLLVGYWEGLNALPPDAARYTNTGWGLWKGKIIFMEGHRGVEMGIAIVYLSDDKGATWKQADGGLFGWFDERGVPNGQGGIIDVYEPCMAETNDGRVMFLGRSKTGRLVYAYSLNDGQTWYSVLPTELSSSQSPPIMVQLPKTGDLLCVWNQVSEEEINRGFLRGRLSSAISKDSGMTWQNFKTIELQEDMEDIARVTPSFPIPRVTRARPGIGFLPDGFAMFTYPNIDIVGDKVFLRYSRMWPCLPEGGTAEPDALPKMWPDVEEAGATMTGEGVMRVYPVEWFYS